MAVKGRSTRLLVTTVIAHLVFIHTVAGEGNCSDVTLLATGSSQYITSPGYPSYYLSNTDCHWTITAESPSQVVYLKVLDLHLERYATSCDDADYVYIYDGYQAIYNRISTLCGRGQRVHFTSTDSFMTVVFHSDSSANYRGFKLEYTSMNKSAVCPSSSLTASPTVQYLTSPNYPNPYPSDMDCRWYITSSPYRSSGIVLEIKRLNLKGNQTDCSSDYVKIYDGSSTYSRQIQVLCGDMENGTFESTGSDITVVFHSGVENGNNTGFNISYRSKTTSERRLINTDTSFNEPDLTSLNEPDLTSLNEPDLTSYNAPDLISYNEPDLTSLNAPDLTSLNAPDLTSDTSYTSGHFSYFRLRLVILPVFIIISIVSIVIAACKKKRQQLLLRRTSDRIARNTTDSTIGAITRRVTLLYVRINGQKSTPDPPAYTRLSDDLPPYTPRSLPKDEKADNCQIVEDVNVTNRDETERDQMTGPTMPYSIV